MSAPAKTEDMITATERRELRTVVRSQMKVLRSEIAQREGDLIKEMEKRLVERYREDDATAVKLNKEIQKLAERSNTALNKLKEKYEELFSGGQWGGREGFHAPTIYRRNEDRAQLRRALEAGIKAELKAARVSLDRQEADLLLQLSVDALRTSAARAFLATLPTAVELMPSQKIIEIEAQYDENPNKEAYYR